MKAALTERLLRRLAGELAPGDEVHDSAVPGLSVRAGLGGSLTFSVVFRPASQRRRGGARKRVRLGVWPALALRDARQLAAEQAHADEPGRLTLGALVERFLAESEMGPALRRERRRVFERDVLPIVGADRLASAVGRGDMAPLLAAAVARGAPVQANRTRAHLHRLFSWALELELVTVNPLSGVRRPGVERSRERVLSAAELREAWELFGRMSPALCLGFRFRLATLQRGGEVATMGPAHVSGEWWTIPAELTKMKRRSHSVFLGPIALEILRQAAALGVASDRLFFPSSQTGLPFTTGAWVHALRKVAGRCGWTPHDLRRSPGAFLEDAGFTEYDLSLVLGHTREGAERGPRVTGVYLRSRFERRKRAVALAWDRILGAILAGGDVAAVVSREAGEELVELAVEPDRPASQAPRRG